MVSRLLAVRVVTKKVLIVDDEPAITDGLVELLELEEIPATGAYGGASATRLLAEEEFAVILADVRLSADDQEGFRLLEAAHHLRPEARIASLTAYPTPDTVARLNALGSSIVIAKPASALEVIAVIRRLLEEAPDPSDSPAAIYEQTRQSLQSIAVSRFRLSRDEAHEVVQDAFALFLSKRDSIESVRPWLRGTVVNLCRQRIQRNQRERSRNAPMESELDLDVMAVNESSSEDVLAVREALARVDERTRLLCTLIGIEGWSYEEVAEELGMPIGSVGPSYIRAKAKLRKAMAVVY